MRVTVSFRGLLFYNLSLLRTGARTCACRTPPMTRPSTGVTSFPPTNSRKGDTRAACPGSLHKPRDLRCRVNFQQCVCVCARRRAEALGASSGAAAPTLGSVRTLELRDVRREGAAAVVPGSGPGLPGCVHHQHDHVLQGRPGFLRPHPQTETRSHVSIYENKSKKRGGGASEPLGSERSPYLRVSGEFGDEKSPKF